MKLGANPRPTIGIKIVKSARLGMVKNTLAIESVSSFANGLFLVATPKTIATMLAEIVTRTT
jgi:hypothetical protein